MRQQPNAFQYIGAPVLRKVATPVADINGKVLAFANKCVEYVILLNGLGIAAPQIGVSKRLFVAYDHNRVLRTYINPEITSQSGLRVVQEACLSIPGLEVEVERPEEVSISYINLAGEQAFEDAEGWHAQAFCHEIDHLNGILCTDYATEASSLETIMDGG